MKLSEFQEFNDYYEKNPPNKVLDDTGVRHLNEVPLPAKYEKAPCDCGIVVCEKSFKDEGWTSVKERLPENGDRVLISDGNFIDVAQFNNNNWWILGGFINDITHWMPLPSLPKEK